MLASIITSSIVTGVILFVFRERYKTHLTLLIRKVDRLEGYRSKDFDHTFESIATIWSALAQLDDYLRFDFPTELSDGKVEKEAIRAYFLKIREASALLPADLYISTEQSLDDISRNREEFIREVGSLAQRRDEFPEQNKALLAEANQKRKELNYRIFAILGHLRAEYRAYIVAHHQA